MQKDLREEIIRLVISKSLREYLLAIQTEVSDADLLETIGAAPISIKKKKRLLTRCARDMETEEKARKQAEDAVQDLKKAFSRLYHVDKNNIFMLERHDICSVRGLLRDTTESDCRLIRDFKTVREYMDDIVFYHDADQWDLYDMTYEKERKAHPEWDWKAIEREWITPPDWYWKLWLADIDFPNGKAGSEYQFICDPKGEVQYICSLKGSLSIISGGYLGIYRPPVPYKSGDILHINCFPYAPSDCYCLVLEVKPNKIGCLYPTLSGKIGVGNIEAGYYYENENTCMQYLPPLFCAELHEREKELPDNCAFMKVLSQKLVQNQKLGGAIGERINDKYSWMSWEDESDGWTDLGRTKERWRFDEEEWHIEQETLFEWINAWEKADERTKHAR